MSTEIVIQVGDLEFRADSSEDEPRALDVEIGRRAGLARPRKIRDIIRRAIADGSMRENQHFSRAPSQGAPQKPGKNGVVLIQHTEAFWLTEAGALKLITRLRTPQADAMVDEIIRVYLEAKNQLRTTSGPTLPFVEPAKTYFETTAAGILSSAQVRDNPEWQRELRQRMGYVSFVQGVTWRKVEGCLRKHLGVISYLRISGVHMSEARRALEFLASGAVTIERKVYALPPDKRQTSFPFPSDPRFDN